MNDLEMREACANALGWKHLGAVGVVDPSLKYAREYSEKYPDKRWCLSGGNDWWISPEGHDVCGLCCEIPDPLHDDAQMAALIKRFNLSTGRARISKKWVVCDFVDLATGRNEMGYQYQIGEAVISAHNADLNAAVVECVAKIWRAKNEH